MSALRRSPKLDSRLSGFQKFVLMSSDAFESAPTPLSSESYVLYSSPDQLPKWQFVRVLERDAEPVKERQYGGTQLRRMARFVLHGSDNHVFDIGLPQAEH